MSSRRLVCALLTLALLFAAVPSPARAESTESEIAQGKEGDKQILQQYTIVADPLLNGWVNDVGQKLWAQTARHDVPYNIKILDQADINSFTVGGGYIYVNSGLLDFVQSDDELAGVIGHETGHNERRHTVTLPMKAQLLNLVIGIASIFSPFLYRFGQIGEAALIAKWSRQDELQADQYGLLLMSRAGYDPDAMVAFMTHLGAVQNEHSSLVDKYLEDHPGFPDRVKHLVGYAELDPTKRTTDQILVQAVHDQATSRYNVAAMKYAQVLKADPENPVALLHLGQTQIALGETSKSEQTLAEAASKGTPETRVAATANIRSLQQSESRFIPLSHPNLDPLRGALDAASATQAQTVSAVAVRHDAGSDQLKAVQGRLDDISYEIPNLGNLNVRRGSRAEAVIKNLNAMSRAIDVSLSKSTVTIAGVGSMERNKEGGLIRENGMILGELAAPLKLDPVPPQSLALLPSYPRMLDDMALTDGNMLQALDAARTSLALLDVGLGDVDTFIKRLSRSIVDMSGDISTMDYNQLVPLMQTANDQLNKAAVAGSQAGQLYNLARARQLQTRITMLGVGYPEDRYATLQTALQNRVKNPGIDFTTMQHQGLTPGEVATAAIVAADTNTTPAAVIAEAANGNERLVDVANARGMDAQALEIFLGLVYLDYTDDPQKEAHDHSQS